MRSKHSVEIEENLPPPIGSSSVIRRGGGVFIIAVEHTNRDCLVYKSSLSTGEIANGSRAEFPVWNDEHAPVGDALENGAVPSDALNQTLERTATAGGISYRRSRDEVADFERPIVESHQIAEGPGRSGSSTSSRGWTHHNNIMKSIVKLRNTVRILSLVDHRLHGCAVRMRFNHH